MDRVPEVLLSCGHKMPVIGMGTAISPLPQLHHLTTACIDAIKTGYRHFDTASAYGTEQPLGRAVKEAIELDLIKSRDQLFITSKLWCCDAHHDLVLPALNETLRKLELDYVDLYLVHWPVRMKKGVDFHNSGKEEDVFLPFDIKGTWEAMEECCKLGLAKSIGVSNFSCAKLSQLLQHATIPPSVNQVEMNVGWQQKKLVLFCREKGIEVCAWSPLGANGARWGSLAVMESPVLKRIAETKGKSVAQIALRWIYEQGVCSIVKSFNKERMKENLQILNWELTDEEVVQIQQIPQSRGFSGEPFVHPSGPYKTTEELWDGEV